MAFVKLFELCRLLEWLETSCFQQRALLFQIIRKKIKIVSYYFHSSKNLITQFRKQILANIRCRYFCYLCFQSLARIMFDAISNTINIDFTVAIICYYLILKLSNPYTVYGQIHGCSNVCINFCSLLYLNTLHFFFSGQ